VTPSGPGGRAATILHSAIPVLAGAGEEPGRVVGAVLVSQSTGRTLAALGEVRLGIFRVFLASVAVAVMLTLLASTTIARPLGRLRDRAAAIVDRRGRLTGRFQGSEKLDEIGDLARALAALTHRLEQRMRFIEAFAADVSHELKNPRASIRTATEVMAEVDGEADRRRFTGIVLAEVARIERLLSGLREIGSLDARLEDEAAEPVAVGELVAGVVEGYRLRAAGAGARRGDRPAHPAVEIDLALPGEPLAARIAPERLGQVVENLLDNAISFSSNGAGEAAAGGPPEPARVRVEVGRDGGAAVLAVSDRGPGIPPDHGERIFDRFFTYRPGEPAGRDGHTGLGLAIVKAIVEGHGGTVRAANRPEGGARFEVRLPLAV
jgi:two-component system sensor histidine kinase ChvG